MAAKRKPAYKFKLFRGKRPVALKRLRFAESFELWYGSKRVVRRTFFAFKRVGERRQFMLDLVQSVETARLRKLQSRRKKYAKKKTEEYKKQVKRKLRRQVPERDLELGDELAKSFRESEKQKLVFPLVKAIDPETVRSGGKVRDSMIIPIAPDGMKYTKQVIDKMMVTPELGKYHLAILDLTLDREAYVHMSADNFEEAYQEAAIMILPSLLDYFQQTKRSSNLYILRLKFLNRWDSDSKFHEHGISWFRTELTEDNQVFNLFRRTFVQLFGPADPYDRDTRGKLRTNYLQGDRGIVITGATLEAMSEHGDRR